MRSAEGAVAWMRDQHERGTTGWQGWCLRASRTAWGLPGGWDSANAWWAAVPPEHRHPFTRTPPLGAPVYYAGGSWGHIGLADGIGNLWHTDAPTVDRIGRTDIAWPVDRWRFRAVGWASWLNGSVLPLSTDTDTGNDSTQAEGQRMDRAEVTRRQPQRIGAAWSWLTQDVETRDAAGVHFRDGILSVGNRRFDIVAGFTLAPVAADTRVSVQAVMVDSSNRISRQFPTLTFRTGAGLPGTVGGSWAGFCSADRRIRLRARVLDGDATVLPTLTVTRW